MDRQRIMLPLNLIIATLATSTASVFIRFAQGTPSLVIPAYILATMAISTGLMSTDTRSKAIEQVVTEKS